MPLERFIAGRGNRRDFLEKSARNAAGVAVGVGVTGATGMALAASSATGESANETVNIGVIGVRSRGKKLAETFASMPNCYVASICDVDGSNFSDTTQAIEQHQVRPKFERDFRRILDDDSIDAVVIATPDHWHGIMTVLACQAGKDVYVEKPMAHNVDEERQIISAAERHQRIVQVGLQQRSAEHFQSAIEFVRSGQLGTVRLAKAWTAHCRRPISVSNSRVPQGVNYDMWLGPAEKRTFNVSHFHHHWRWHWDFGTGELGNWGIHMLDIARLGLNVELPNRISSASGNLHFKDQETPDFAIVGYEFDDSSITWEHRQWSKRPIEGRSAATAFYGDKGTLIVDRSGWKVYESDFKAGQDGTDSTAKHCQDFINSVRTRSQPTCPAESAHRSGSLCHLGNIAMRTRRDLEIDATDPNFGIPAEACELLSRSYRTRFAMPDSERTA